MHPPLLFRFAATLMLLRVAFPAASRLVGTEEGITSWPKTWLNAIAEYVSSHGRIVVT
jgi:hypothetical protein